MVCCSSLRQVTGRQLASLWSGEREVKVYGRLVSLQGEEVKVVLEGEFTLLLEWEQALEGGGSQALRALRPRGYPSLSYSITDFQDGSGDALCHELLLQVFAPEGEGELLEEASLDDLCLIYAYRNWERRLASRVLPTGNGQVCPCCGSSAALLARLDCA